MYAPAVLLHEKVKVAEHILTGHKVAIKILNRRKIKAMDMEEKGKNLSFMETRHVSLLAFSLKIMHACNVTVKREIKILRLFMHPHIIRLYEVIESATDLYVITEYVKVCAVCFGLLRRVCRCTNPPACIFRVASSSITSWRKAG